MEPGTPYDRSSGLLRPPADATGFSAVREVRGALVQYTGVDCTRGWAGVEHFIRTLRAVGFVAPCRAGPSYAVLDVLNTAGDIVFEYDVPNAKAWRFIYRKLGLRVERVPTR